MAEQRDLDVENGILPYIWAILQMRQGEHSPPFEVEITGADGGFVCRFRMNADGDIETLALSGTKLCFPITATLTDQFGKEWQTIIEREAIQ